MNERQHTTQPALAGASGFWDQTADSETTTRVVHGLHQERLPVVGLTVHRVRELFAARLGMDAGNEAFVDGHPVGEDRVVRAGEILHFAQRLGVRGVAPRNGKVHPALTQVTIEGATARATSPEGVSASVPWPRLYERIAPREVDTGDFVAPDGVRCVRGMRAGCIVVHQSAPRVANVRWIAPGSKLRYGPGAEYRPVRISLPYVVVLAIFTRGDDGLLQLTGANEAFFTNEPLASLDHRLCFPALLNCSRFLPAEGKPLSWICTQHIEPTARPEDRDDNARLRRGLTVLQRHLLEGAFNESSERHEHSSWFSETVAAAVDPRLASIEAWEAATTRDSNFALQVPWLPTGCTLRVVLERIQANAKRGIVPVGGADELARFIFNDAADEPADNDDPADLGFGADAF